MKVFILTMTAVMFSITMKGQSQSGSLEVGDYSNASELYNGSYFDMAPTNFYLDHYASQMLYIYDTDFADFSGKSNVKITKIHFKFYDQSVYSDISANVKYYLQEVEENEFQQDADGDKVYFDCIGTITPAVEQEYYYEAFTAYGEDVEMVIDLSDNPFQITPGKNLLITAVFDLTSDCMSSSDDAPFYTSGISKRVMTYSDNNTSFLDYANDSKYPKCSGGTATAELPVTLIDYTYTLEETKLKGDLNDDGQLTTSDITILIDYILGEKDIDSEETFGLADMDENGSLSVNDVTILVSEILNGNQP